MNVDEAIAVVEQIWEGKDLDDCLNLIKYFKQDLDDVAEEYLEKLKEREVHVTEMGVIWNEHIQEYQIRAGFSNGQSRDIAISNSGPVHTSETLAWMEPKHYQRVNFIAFIVALARTYDGVYDQDSLANEAYHYLNPSEKEPDNQKAVWRWLAWMPERCFSRATDWMIKKNAE